MCAGLLAAAPSAGAAQAQGLGSGLDPSAAGSVLSRARMGAGGSSVLIEPKGESTVAIPGGAAPSVDGDLLAYEDSQGVKVINWRTSALVQRLDGDVSKPALDWPLLAVVRKDSTYRRLVIVDYTNPGAPTERQILRVKLSNELGRPALAGGRVAWDYVWPGGSTDLHTGARHRAARGRREELDRRARKPVLDAEPDPVGRPVLPLCALRTRRFGSSATKGIYRRRATRSCSGRLL